MKIHMALRGGVTRMKVRELNELEEIQSELSCSIINHDWIVF